MIGAKFLLTCFFLLPLAAYGFNYDNTLDWVKEAPQCAGLKQSPISLDLRWSKPLRIYPMEFHNMDIYEKDPLKVFNNGNTIELEVGVTKNGFRPFITGAGLDAYYEVMNHHFHWGSPTVKGSEHALGGRKYDLEMHVVAKNVKHQTLEEARNDPFGLAVIALLFEAVDNEVTDCGIDDILNVLPQLTQANSEVLITKPMKIGKLFGKVDPREFYTYRGSLTTPPCSQSVTWIVMNKTLPIEKAKMERFYQLSDKRGLPLLNTFRPLQRHNGRKIFSNQYLGRK